ncbi:hypothetical protein CEXT_463551 [Caerostris extrusa]|uniref:Uncharacterized protein n=1 Tax=Caerostris extrusa TaxID=172846 RepID=A0AAV4PBP8_CAEEX|nr:hypothetical protein CEXT_463551 [Caerostris extrusa]
MDPVLNWIVKVNNCDARNRRLKNLRSLRKCRFSIYLGTTLDQIHLRQWWMECSVSEQPQISLKIYAFLHHGWKDKYIGREIEEFLPGDEKKPFRKTLLEEFVPSYSKNGSMANLPPR